MCREIGGRRNRRHPQRRPDRDGDHVLGELLSEPDAGIVPFCNYVGKAGLDVDLDVNVRILGEEGVDHRPSLPGRYRVACPALNRPAVDLAERAGVLTAVKDKAR